MRPTRGTAALAALVCSLGLLAGCSDDAGGEADGTPTSAPTEEQRGACEAEVELTGGLDASWSGEGFVVTENRSGPVLYKTSHQKLTLTLLGEDDDFPAVASLTTKQGTLSGSEGTIDVDPEGGGAEVETTLTGGQGKPVDLVATFTC